MFSTLAHRERAAPESTWAWSPQASETTRGMSRFGARWARWFFDSRQELTWSRESLIIKLVRSPFVFENPRDRWPSTNLGHRYDSSPPSCLVIDITSSLDS